MSWSRGCRVTSSNLQKIQKIQKNENGPHTDHSGRYCIRVTAFFLPRKAVFFFFFFSFAGVTASDIQFSDYCQSILRLVFPGFDLIQIGDPFVFGNVHCRSPIIEIFSFQFLALCGNSVYRVLPGKIAIDKSAIDNSVIVL